jgi:hypothetical protein
MMGRMVPRSEYELFLLAGMAKRKRSLRAKLATTDSDIEATMRSALEAGATWPEMAQAMQTDRATLFNFLKRRT